MGPSTNDLKQLYAAYNLYANWNHMSPAQKSRAVVSLGVQGYKFASGNDFSKEFLVKPGTGSPGLTYGDAFSLFGSGVNVYSLAKNWDQLNTLQKITGGATTGMNLAQTAKNFGLLGFGTKGAAAKGIKDLAQAGWNASPSFGVGAVTAPAGTTVPAGYTAIPSGIEGHVTAVPIANASSAGGAVSGTPAASWGTPSYAGYTAAALEGVNAINALTSDMPDKDKAFQVQKAGAMAVADIYTAGGASAAYALINSVPLGRKLTGAIENVLQKVDPLSNAIGMFDTDRWKVEGDKLKALREKGTFVPDELLNSMPTRGRTKDELVALENEKLSQGQFGNPKFAASRDLRDTTGKDFAGYSAFAEKDPQWFNKPVAERVSFAQKALDAGAIREHNGTIDVDWKKLEDPGTPPKTDINGTDGGSQLQAGLARMAKNDPYTAGALIAHSAFSPSFQAGDASHAFDNLKDHFDTDSLTLANGATADVKKQSDRTNTKHDLDYYAGLSGITLTEMLAADKHPSVTKAGQKIGNAMLGDVGSGAPFTPENFGRVRDNFRSAFSKAGISSLSDAYKLSNVLYAGERINDTDLIRMHQVADMTFGEGGHDIGMKLFPGRTRGLEVAGEGAPDVTPGSNVVMSSKDRFLQKNKERYGGMSGAV